jgi:hypothetical protein
MYFAFASITPSYMMPARTGAAFKLYHYQERQLSDFRADAIIEHPL